MPPDVEFPFGTDADGRDLFAVLVYGTLLTLKVGVVAGLVGVAMGTTIAFLATYRGGWVDAGVRVLVDVLITIPTLLVLVVVASAIRTSMSTSIMAITIALLAWREPARQIRAQVLQRAGRGDPAPGHRNLAHPAGKHRRGADYDRPRHRLDGAVRAPPRRHVCRRHR